MFLADGLATKVNEEGITYYNNVINALLERGKCNAKDTNSNPYFLEAESK